MSLRNNKIKSLAQISSRVIANNIIGDDDTKLENMNKLNLVYLDRKIIEEHLENDKMNEFINSNNKTLLIEYYIANGYIDYLRIIFKYYPEYINEVNTDMLGETPLFTATSYDKYDISELLLENDADPNLQDFEYMDTPLINSTNNNNTDIVYLLLEYGANPDLQNRYGYTPLHIACENGNIDIVYLLLEYDADPNLENRYGYTPLNIAYEKGYTDIIELLNNF